MTIFGRDEVKWLIINSAIGILGIVSLLDWILHLFGKSVSDFPAYVHIIPSIYFVLYTFLLRRAVIHVLKVKDGTPRQRLVDIGYVVISIGFYLLF